MKRVNIHSVSKSFVLKEMERWSRSWRECESRESLLFLFLKWERLWHVYVLMGMIQERGKIDHAYGRDSHWREILSKREQIDSVKKRKDWPYTGLQIHSKYRKAGRELEQTEVDEYVMAGACEKFLLITSNFSMKWKARSSTESEDMGEVGHPRRVEKV